MIASGVIEYGVFHVEKFVQPIVNKKEVKNGIECDIKDFSGAITKFLNAMGKLAKVDLTDNQKTKNEKLANLKMTIDLQRELGIFHFNKAQKFYLNNESKSLINASIPSQDSPTK